jgi:Rhabdovirus nucleocapsid protein
MFRFADHELVFLRAGTLTSRHKQCMGLLDIYYADTAFYLKRGEILNWFFVDQVADEIHKIYSQPDELSQSNSYLPYCVDLGLVTKYPYSATANPAVHNWVHILGALGGMEWSKKAAVVGSPAPALVLAAATTAYGLDQSTDMRQTFTKEDEEELVELDGLDAPQVRTIGLLQKRPIDHTAKGWVAWAWTNTARNIVGEYFWIQVRHFKKNRPKSVEAFLSAYLISWSLIVRS